MITINHNTITCGDNLYLLQQIADQSVNLVYLDPPFESSIEGNHFSFNETELQQYLEMMRPRLKEVRRTMKEDGSLFYHCDWPIEAHIQLLLDEIFGKANLIAKIIWQRSKPSATQRYLPHTYDVILFYGKSRNIQYFPQYAPFSESEAESYYKYIDSETGKRYRLESLTSSNTERSDYTYEFLGIKRTWRISKEKMEEEYKQGRIVQSKPGAVPMRKRYMGEGKLFGDVWADIPAVHRGARESIGYPAQKPRSLLRRIIQMVTTKEDLILDPFCGSGTTLVAAEELGRSWIGIDISPTACQIAAQRIHDINPNRAISETLQIQDLRRFEEILNLPYYEFENWVIATLKKLINENPAFFAEKGFDTSKKLEFYPIAKRHQLDLFLDHQEFLVPIMVKQKEVTNLSEIKVFRNQLVHHNRLKGILIALGFSDDVHSLIKGYQTSGIDIVPIRVQQLISEDI